MQFYLMAGHLATKWQAVNGACALYTSVFLVGGVAAASINRAVGVIRWYRPCVLYGLK